MDNNCGSYLSGFLELILPVSILKTADSCHVGCLKFLVLFEENLKKSILIKSIVEGGGMGVLDTCSTNVYYHVFKYPTSPLVTHSSNTQCKGLMKLVNIVREKILDNVYNSLATLATRSGVLSLLEYPSRYSLILVLLVNKHWKPSKQESWDSGSCLNAVKTFQFLSAGWLFK